MEKLTDGDRMNVPVLHEAGYEGCPTEEGNNVSWDLTPRGHLAGGEGTNKLKGTGREGAVSWWEGWRPDGLGEEPCGKESTAAKTMELENTAAGGAAEEGRDGGGAWA